MKLSMERLRWVEALAAEVEEIFGDVRHAEGRAKTIAELEDEVRGGGG